jgi:uncharacterized protein (TIGR04255 family)
MIESIAEPLLVTPPLIETIFELRWELLQDSRTQRYRDPAYPMMYGRIYERFKDALPLFEDLPSSQTHPEVSPYVVRHWMRKGKDLYPLIQVGPGIITVNMTKDGYSWNSLVSLIQEVVEAVLDLYPQGTLPLKFVKSELRYLNAIPFYSQEGIISFLKEQLHMDVGAPKALLARDWIYPDPVALSLKLGYGLRQPLGHLVLALDLGEFQQTPAYLLQTIVQSFKNEVGQDEKKLSQWLREAHLVCKESFQAFCEGQLMELFRQELVLSPP